MSEITYVEGDATAPIGEGPKVIVHVCNDVGSWGRGFVLAISKRWKAPEKEFKAWHASGEGFALGEVRFVPVGDQLCVANLAGQHGLKRKGGQPPVRYPAIRSGLEKVAAFAVEHRASVHMPRIGCGLAGGEWDQIEPILIETLQAAGAPVIVYSFTA